MTSILYPRTIQVRRLSKPGPVGGSVGFGGASPLLETVVASGLCSSIQYKRVGIANPTELPTDSRRSQWQIIIPPQTGTDGAIVQLGLITENDTIVDDLGKRYQVYAADWQVLGYTLLAELVNS